MSLVKEQDAFRRDVTKLHTKMDELGIVATFGECYRTPVQAWINALPAHSHVEAISPDGNMYTFSDTVGGVGIAKSLHGSRLAIDYNFFTSDGKPLNTKTPELVILGEYWESLDVKNRWGGNFTATPQRPYGDLFHFERSI